MTETTSLFVMPDEEQPREVRQAAYDAMNSIKLTIEQLDTGYAIFRHYSDDEPKRGFQERRMDAVRAYCTRQGLLPADVAAETIIVRYRPIVECWSEGIDPRRESPTTYAGYAADPMDLFEFGLEPRHQNWEE